MIHYYVLLVKPFLKTVSYLPKKGGVLGLYVRGEYCLLHLSQSWSVPRKCYPWTLSEVGGREREAAKPP